MRARWMWGIFVALVSLGVTLALATVPALNGPATWASPGNSPLYQTVPPPPADDNGGDDKDDGDDRGTAPTSTPDGSPAYPTEAVAPVAPVGGPARFPNTRLGVAVVNQPIDRYDLSGLNIGWYVNYSTADVPLRPDGIEFVQTVRVHQKKSGWCVDCYTRPYTYTMRPDAATLVRRVIANPGATWVIGNEIDRRDWNGGGQDEITPEVYARAYGEIRGLIKGADPTARLAIGGVMQATPLRLRYLDLIWDAYVKLYGHGLGEDVDVWNVHNFILREERNNWGAGIPPGLADSQGLLVEATDNDSIVHFTENIVRFRTWLRDRGERNKPLYLTEFGINMPVEYIPTERVKKYMNATFDYLLSATDPELGYPPDDNRLVQRFLWYSLDDSQDSPSRVEPYADSLFSSVTAQRLPYGQNWAAYTAAPEHVAASTPRLNLVAARVATVLPAVQAGGPLALTLRAQVFNSGNVTAATADGITVRFRDGAGAVIGEQVLRELPGGAVPVVVEQRWVAPAPGSLTWSVEIESLPGEESWADNAMTVNVDLQ